MVASLLLPNLISANSQSFGSSVPTCLAGFQVFRWCSSRCRCRFASCFRSLSQGGKLPSRIAICWESDLVACRSGLPQRETASLALATGVMPTSPLLKRGRQTVLKAQNYDSLTDQAKKSRETVTCLRIRVFGLKPDAEQLSFQVIQLLMQKPPAAHPEKLKELARTEMQRTSRAKVRHTL